MQITTQTNNNEYADNVHGSTYQNKESCFLPSE